jgi:LPS export ABC transporter ATP-binding protein
LKKSFGSRQVTRGVSIYVRRGEAVGLLGPNGAGKTTVFYMITGLIKPDSGAIELDGHDVTQLPMYQRARLGIGYLPQEASIFRGLTVEQNIRAVLEVVEPSRKKRERELDGLLEEFNIQRLRKSPSIALSGGERRRVEIARALATRPNYMLLDEPFAGIDPIAVGDIQDLVRHLTNRGIGVLITDHNVRETLGLTDRAYIDNPLLERTRRSRSINSVRLLADGALSSPSSAQCRNRSRTCEASAATCRGRSRRSAGQQHSWRRLMRAAIPTGASTTSPAPAKSARRRRRSRPQLEAHDVNTARAPAGADAPHRATACVIVR